MFEGFKTFILKGNVVDMAVGVVIGASFSGVVTALVKSLITPFIGAFGGVPDFSGLFFTVNNSKFMIGDFINALLSFVIVASVIYFFVVIPMNRVMAKLQKKTEAAPTDKTCPECLSKIPVKARRCKWCTAVVGK